MTPTIEVPEALTAQYNTLTSKLADIEQQQSALNAQRAEVEASLSRIQNAIRYLNGEMIPVVKEGTVRRPMSAEARENIRQGLLRAAAAKKAKANAAQIGEKAPAPVSATVPSVESKTGRSAKRGAAK